MNWSGPLGERVGAGTRLGIALTLLVFAACSGNGPVAPAPTPVTPPVVTPDPTPPPTPPPDPTPPPPPTPPAPTRVMPLGDSITQGAASRDSYRRPLWKMLQDGGYRVDFVGSLNTNYQGGPPVRDFDVDHEGHWGWRADEVLAQIAGWARDTRPEVVLLHLGTNDAIEGQDPSTTISEIERIVDRLRDANAGVTVIVAQVIPAVDSAWNGRIRQVNALIPSVARKSTPDSPVVVIDQSAGFNAQSDTYDGVHPTAAGETKIATRWYDALVRVLGRPQTTAGVVPTLLASPASDRR